MAERDGQRRLAAIVAMDIVGYSRMMGVDEDGTLARIKAIRAELIQPTMTAFHGRLVKTSGDGFLLEFASVVDAFRFASEIQDKNVLRNAALSPETAMTFRIGLNIGDVIIDDGDVYGDGVNIAARLEQMADPGGICLSDRAWRDVRNFDVTFEDLGPRQLKNIADPIHVYRTVQATNAGGPRSPRASPPSRSPRSPLSGRRPVAVTAAIGLLILLLAAGGWWWLRSPGGVAHSMTVRLAGFQLLSADLPATMRDTVNAEIAAAFNADGVVGVSTASAPAAGTAPAFALGGTIQREGSVIRVITRLTNERSGATVWGDTFNYDGQDAAKVPRHIAVDAGNVVRCGLFGASTYRKPLPDAVFRNYMQFCEAHWNPMIADGRKGLVPAQRVVAALPDFSWGWAAVAGAYWKVAVSAGKGSAGDEARANGRQAADRAVAIDGKNSEALYIKSMLVDRQDWLAREALLSRAIAARQLDCGCEYHQYGWLLLNVGRVADSVERLRQANDMLALYLYTPLNLADALLAAGQPEAAKPLFDAASELAPNADFAQYIQLSKALETEDIEALSDPKLLLPPQLRAALLNGYRAVRSGNADAKAKAIPALLALPQAQQGDAVAMLLAELGATRDALRVAVALADKAYPGPSIFWYPAMRDTLREPGFPGVMAKLGLIDYWKTTKTRPDVCNDKAPPAFCRTI
ncbi:MAG: adenylate/guanylate cyclase domain-containing protein [Pseudomonadota bacterium]